LLLLSILILVIALAGCGSDTQPSAPVEEQPPAEEAPQSGEEGMYTPEYRPNGEEVAVFKTSQGDITVKLYGTAAPIHVGNFVELVRKGFYDDTKFHRYEPGFVIQGGDPQTLEASSEEVAKAAGTPGSVFGTGGPGYFIRGEFDPSQNPNKHVEGALGMARAQSPDSAGSQFYFALDELPMLDGSYTVFGVVTKGMDVVNKLRAGDVIEKIELSGTTE
jgi:peptidyl-prolyl cis-trans isomerase B (cyclophilin B)